MQPPAHFLAGAAVCRNTRWRPLGLLLAFASHYALDALPHFEDPSILPAALAPTAGRNWQWLLFGTHAVAALLAVWVWVRFARTGPEGRRQAAYLVLGGLLACAPDYVGLVGDPWGLLGHLNTGAHRWWFIPYIGAVHGHSEWRPAIAFACIGVELLACGVSAWLLLRRTDDAARTHDDADRAANPLRATGLPEGDQPADDR